MKEHVLIDNTINVSSQNSWLDSFTKNVEVPDLGIPSFFLFFYNHISLLKILPCMESVQFCYRCSYKNVN